MSFIASKAVSDTSAAIVGLRDAEGSDETIHLVLETLQAAVKAGWAYCDRGYTIARRILGLGRSYYCVTSGVPCPLVPRKQKPCRVTLLFKLVHPIRKNVDEWDLKFKDMLQTCNSSDIYLDLGKASPAASCVSEDNAVSFLAHAIQPIYDTLSKGLDETIHLVLETLQAAVKAVIEGTQLHVAYRDLEDLTTVSHRYDRKGVPCPLVPRKQKPCRVTLLFKLVHPIRKNVDEWDLKFKDMLQTYSSSDIYMDLGKASPAASCVGRNMTEDELPSSAKRKQITFKLRMIDRLRA
nr:START domain, START-like domain protein [Tanacetum cinerariifolium]